VARRQSCVFRATARVMSQSADAVAVSRKIRAIMVATMFRRPAAKILGAFAVLLVLSNLQCFAACLVTPCDSAPQVVKLPPCHRQQPPSSSHDRSRCPRQAWVSSEKATPILIGAALQPSYVARPAPLTPVAEFQAIPCSAPPLDHSPPGSPILRI
jgi:hypothetical protein